MNVNRTASSLLRPALTLCLIVLLSWPIKNIYGQDLRKIVLASRADTDSTQIVRQGGLSRGFEQHAASLRNDLRVQAQTRPQG